MTRANWLHGSLLVLCVLLPFLLPVLSRNDYFMHTLISIALMAILAIGVRLVLLSGNMHFAQAGFYGVGAFTSALLVMQLGLSSWLTLLVAGLVATLLSVVVGVPSLRVKGPYFAMITMAFNEVLRLVFTSWSLTGATFGVAGVPAADPIPGLAFGSKVDYFYLVLVLLLVVAAVAYWIERTRTGLTLAAIRQADALAESVGVNVFRFKLAVFMVACLFAGLAGAFYAHYNGFVSATDFTFHRSAEVVIAVIVGGRYLFVGPIVGSAFLVLMGVVIGGFEQYIPFAYGGILIVVLLFLPTGLASLPGLLRSKWARRTAKAFGPIAERSLDVAS